MVSAAAIISTRAHASSNGIAAAARGTVYLEPPDGATQTSGPADLSAHFTRRPRGRLGVFAARRSRRWSPRRVGDVVRGRRGRPPRAASVRRSDARRGNASFDVIAGGDRRLANAGGARAAEVVAAGARTAARAGEPGVEKPTFSTFRVAALRRDGVQGSGAAIPAP